MFCALNACEMFNQNIYHGHYQLSLGLAKNSNYLFFLFQLLPIDKHYRQLAYTEEQTHTRMFTYMYIPLNYPKCEHHKCRSTTTISINRYDINFTKKELSRIVC